jgi:transcriptional regulator with XRE-family HTH domain
VAEDALDTAIGAALREARLHRLRTQEELGAALGVGRTAISHYETGRRELTVKDLIRLAQALGCTPVDLLPPPHRPTALDGLPPALASVVALLQTRPDLAEMALEMLETRLSFEQEHERT